MQNITDEDSGINRRFTQITADKIRSFHRRGAEVAEIQSLLFVGRRRQTKTCLLRTITGMPRAKTQRAQSVKILNRRFTQINADEDSGIHRRGRRDQIFCLSGDDDKQKPSSIKD